MSQLLNVTGIVKKAGAYPFKDGPRSYEYEGKTITNTHRLSLQLDDGNWYGLGDTDKTDFIVKDNEGAWKIVGAGSQVLIQYKLSDCGKFRNSKKSLLTVLTLVEGKRYEPAGGSSPSAATNSGGAASSNGVNPAEVGQAINLTGLTLDELTKLDDFKVKAYVGMYKVAKERFTAAFNEPNTPAQSAHVPSPVPAPEPEPEFTDLIPF